MLRMLLLSLGVWVCTLLLYSGGILLAAAVVEHAEVAAAETAAAILLVFEVVVACLAVAFVFFHARRNFPTSWRFLWGAAFALIQFGTCVLAAVLTLVVLNR